MLHTLNALVSVLALSLLWSLLSEGDPSSWLVGAPVVLAAAWASRRIGTDEAVSVSFFGLLRFLPFFLWESMRGGIDVARRVLGSHLHVAPGFIAYRTRLRGPQARLLFVNCVALIPGTLAADIEDDQLKVHALDSSADLVDELHQLESAVGRIYREAL